MQKTIRKTHKMIAMEYQYGKPIDELILETLANSDGEQKGASRKLNMSEATLCRWIHELDLTRNVSVIRKHNGLPPTTRELRMETKSGEELISIAVISPCTECGKRFEELKIHNITGVNVDNEELIAVVRDEMNIKHWFKLDRSKEE